MQMNDGKRMKRSWGTPRCGIALNSNVNSDRSQRESDLEAIGKKVATPRSLHKSKQVDWESAIVNGRRGREAYNFG